MEEQKKLEIEEIQKIVDEPKEDQSIKPETIARLICLAITTINTILTFIGKNPLPFSNTEVYQYITLTADIVVKAWAWWKNNSFTSDAIKADKVLGKLKIANVLNVIADQYPTNKEGK